MKPIILITIDMEFSNHPEDIGIFGHIDGVDYGVPMIMRLLRKYNLRATFFVDVYINKSKHRENFIYLCKSLQKEGHDLQLHTHPFEMFDCRRYGMREYNLEEQIEIIKRGKDLFYEWFATQPVAHRAGDWAANYDTLKALKANNIFVDSSVFWGWSNCLLNGDLAARNSLGEYDGILEIPASIFECPSLGLFTPFRLISTDANSFKETWDIFHKLKENHIPVINTVYHSFSFLKWNPQRTEYSVAKNRLMKFEMLLKALSESKDFEVKTVYELSELYKSNPELFLKKNDYIPKAGLGTSFDRIIDRLRS